MVEIYVILMEMRSTEGHGKMTLCMATVSTNTPQELFTLVIGSTECTMEGEPMNGQEVIITQVNGKTIKCMEKEHSETTTARPGRTNSL